MLTGCRRDEIGSLRKAELDEGEALLRFPAARTKQGRPHEVPLGPVALALARELLSGGDAAFGAWSRSKERLDGRIARAVAGGSGVPVTGWRLHDLRRSLASHWAELLGAEPWIIEEHLGHAHGGHKQGVAKVYQKATYLPRRRRLAERWEQLVLGTATLARQA